MALKELEDKINKDLKNQYVPSYILLDRLRVIDEDSRKTSSYVDPYYIPFYYYLGKYLKPFNLLEIEVNLGFFSCSFFKSCVDVDSYLGFQSKTKDFH